MIKTRVKTKLRFKQVKSSAQKAAENNLARASAFLRTTIKRGIRYRKNKESKPGQAPYDHGTFRKSVRFSMDRKNLISYVGPARLINRVQNPDGKLAPETLEFGGTAEVEQKNWFMKNPKNLNSASSLTTFFMHQGYGPFFMAGGIGAIEQAINNTSVISGGPKNWPKYSKKVRFKNAPSGKRISYIQIRMKSISQAARSARNVIQYFGLPKAQKITVAPRPYLSPGLDKAKSRLAGFFVNSLT